MSDIPDTLDPSADYEVSSDRAPPQVPLYDQQAEARLQGYDWPEIVDHINGRTAAALDAGYSKREIDAYLGLPDPKPFQDRLQASMQLDAAVDPETFLSGLDGAPSGALTPLEGMMGARVAEHAGLPAPDTVMPEEGKEPDRQSSLDLSRATTRGEYADAVLSGEVQSPADFAERYAGAFWKAAQSNGGAVDGQTAATVVRAAQGLAATLPSNRALTDQAIAIADDNGLPLTTENIRQVKANLANEWAGTGDTLGMIFQRQSADAELAAKLTQPPVTEPSAVPDWTDFEAASAAEASKAIEPFLNEHFAGIAKDWQDWGELKSAIADRLEGKPLSVRALDAQGIDEAIGAAFGAMPGTIGSKVAQLIKGMPEPKVKYIDPLAPPAANVIEMPASEAAYQEQKAAPLHIAAQDLAVKWGEEGEAGVATLKFTPEGEATYGQRIANQMATDILPAGDRVRYPIDVWHGSPHDFDEFTSEAIGSGEGAQSFGHGLYFAEAKGTAKSYIREDLVLQQMKDEALDEIARAGGKPEALASLERRMEDPRDIVQNPERPLSQINQAAAQLAELQDVHQFIAEDGHLGYYEGTLYRAKLHIDSDLILDWDKPNAIQSPQVRAAIEKIEGEAFGERLSATENIKPLDGTGGEFFENLKDRVGNERASEMLHDEGLHGIRYLDQQSRGAGEGTHNYVIFHDSKIEALEKNGQKIEPKEVESIVDKLVPAYQAATGLTGHFADLLGGLLKDESGALRLFPTQAMRDARTKTSEARDYVQERIPYFRGQGEQLVAHAASVLDNEMRRLIEPHMPEFLRELAKGPSGNSKGTMVGNLYAYMEGRSSGVMLRPDSPFAPLADKVRTLNQQMDALLQDADNRGIVNYHSLWTDYVSHNWKDPLDAAEKFGIPKQGTNASFKLRTIPTTYDGLVRGLTPRYPNPIDGAIADIQGKSAYLHAMELLDRAKKNDITYYASQARGPNDVALDGMGATRATPTQVPVALRQAEAEARANLEAAKAAGVNDLDDLITKVRETTEAAKPGAYIERLYADKGFARPYNDMLSQGLYGRPGTASMYDKWMFMSNTMTGLKMLFPGFHSLVTATETMTGGLANAMQEFTRGEFGRGLKDAGFSIVLPLKLGEMAAKGDRALKAYRALAGDEALDLLVGAGARFGPRQKVYQMGSAPSLWDSFSRGYGSVNPDATAFTKAVNAAVKPLKEIGQDVKNIWTNDDGSAVSALALPGRVLGFLGHEVGRGLTTISAPLMDYTIPRLKIGANMEQMQTYLRQNKTASQEAKMAKAREIANNTDDRHGELNQDNVLWPRMVKQIANAGLVSPGWKFGSARFYAAALQFDLERFRFQPNMTALRTLIGFGMAVATQNILYSWFNTGQTPGFNTTTAWDAIMYRTGNRTPEGAEERGLVPSSIKELFDFAKIWVTTQHDPWSFPQGVWNYIMSAVNPAVQVLHAFTTGEDMIGHKISYTPGGWANFLLSQSEPTAFNQGEQRRKGTGISPFETFIGLKNAPPFMEDPDRYFKQIANLDKRWTNDERSRIIRENKRLETEQPVPDKAPGANIRTSTGTGATSRPVTPNRTQVIRGSGPAPSQPRQYQAPAPQPTPSPYMRSYLDQQDTQPQQATGTYGGNYAPQRGYTAYPRQRYIRRRR